MRYLLSLAFILVGQGLSSSFAFAANEASQTFTLDGQLFHAGSTTPLIDSGAQLRVQILDPSQTCILYEETQNVNTSATDGFFTIQVGSLPGSSKRSGLDSGLTMSSVIQNVAAVSATSAPGKTCASSLYTPAPGDTRYFRITVIPSSGIPDQLTPDMVLDSVPSAIVAQSVEGLDHGSILHTNTNAGEVLTQANLEALFTTAAFTNLAPVLAGQYVQSGTGGANLPTFASNPASPSAGDIWFNSTTQNLVYSDGSTSHVIGTAGAGLSSLTVSSRLTANGAAGGTLSAPGTIDLNTVGTAGTYVKVTTDAYGRVTGNSALAEADIPTLSTAGKVSGTAINTGTIGGNAAINTTGNIQTTNDMTANRYFIYDHAGAGPNYVGMQAPANMTAAGGASYTMVWPDRKGSANQVLTTDGSGNLSWAVPVSGAYVLKAGDTMTGLLVLSADPTANLGAATKQYVDNGLAGYIKKDGSVAFTGDQSMGTHKLTNVTDPASAQDAATKNYADSFLIGKTLPVAPGAGQAGQALRWNNGTLAWEFFAPSTGSVTGVTAGTGLNVGAGPGGTISTTGTLNVNVGTGNNQIVQLDGSSKLPAVNGSQLTNLDAGQIATGLLPLARGGSGAALVPVGKGEIIYSNSTTDLASLAAGTSGYVLTSAGAGAAPTWSAAAPDNTKVLKAGDTMTGLLVLSADPSANLGAATKQYVDNSVSTAGGLYVKKDGSVVFTGDQSMGTHKLTNLTDPGSAQDAATKNYADTTFLKLSGGTLTGAITLPAGTTLAGGAPLYLSSGSLLATRVGGAVEYDGTSLYYTDTGLTRRTLATTTGLGSYLPLAGGTMTGSLVNNTNSASTALAVAQSGSGYAATFMGGNVGIGTTAPMASLQVNEAPVGGALLIQGVSGVNSGNADFVVKTASGNGYWDFAAADSSAGNFIMFDAVNAKAPLVIEPNSSSNSLYIKAGGNVGIGTTSPSSTLDVNGAQTIEEIAAASAPAAAAGKDFIYADNTTHTLKVSLNGGAYNSLLTSANAGVTGVTAGTGLNVGAGPGGSITTTGTLNVNAGTGASQIVQLDGSSRLPAVDGSQLSNLSVGQLTAGVLPFARGGTGAALSPAGKGEIVYSNSTSALTTLAAGSNGYVLTAAGAGNAPTWSPPSTTDSTKVLKAGDTMTGLLILSADPSNVLGAATKEYVDAAVSSVGASYLALAGGTMTGPLLNNSSSASTALAVTQSGAGYAATFTGGNVGIGTSAPGSKLDVNGSVNVSGVITASSSVKVGADATACSATNKGAIRYNTTTNVLEFCNGTGWNLVQAAACTNVTPNVISFSNQANATVSSLYTSNTQQVSGINCSVPVTISGQGSPQYQICADSGCSSVVQGWTSSPSSITNGQYLQTRLTADSVGGSLFQATIIVGSGASVWSVTTAGGDCTASPSVGTVCADGTIYAGMSPDGNVKMYTTHCDAGQTWDGVSSCTGSRTSIPWNNGTGNWTTTGYTNGITGKSNTAGLVALSDAGAPYEAAQNCTTLNMNGHTDWYLPGLQELNVLYSNNAAIKNFDTSGNWYWSSTENVSYNGLSERFSDGNQNNGITKNNPLFVRCVRR